MLSTISPNQALAAKAHAKFGKMLNDKNYQELLACQSVTDVAAYLKAYTHYADVFADMHDTNVHRGMLEERLRQKIFTEYASLCRYELSGKYKLFPVIVMRFEIEQILHCLRLLKSGRPEEYLFVLPAFFDQHTKIDLYELARAESFEQVLSALEHTGYKKIIEPFAPHEGKVLNYIAVETALYKYYYAYVNELIERHTAGSVRDELRQLYGIKAELSNLITIIRLKQYYNAENDYIRSFLLPYRYHISDRELEMLLNAESAEEVRKFILCNTRYGKVLGNHKPEYVEDSAGRIEYSYSKKLFRFSSNPTVIFAAFTVLTEIEVKNLITVIEGIRYHLSINEISKMLIGVEV